MLRELWLVCWAVTQKEFMRDETRLDDATIRNVDFCCLKFLSRIIFAVVEIGVA